MKMLVRKIALLALIVAALLGLFLRAPWLSGEPFHNIATKHAILDRTTGKKIIVVGGSGVANGVSAGVIERRVPGYRAVNMGLNAGLGLRFNLAEVMASVHAGDLIVLSPEYENFEGGYDGSVQILKAVNVAPFTETYVASDRYRNLLLHDGLTFIQLKAQSYFDRLSSVFSHASVQLDDHGDRTSESASRDVAGMGFSFRPTPEAYAACVQLLNDFDRFCRGRGAIALLSYPSLPSPQFAASRREIEALHDRLSQDTRLLILHGPGEMVFPAASFDDTVYHLGKSGREIRSARIADLINARVLRRLDLPASGGRK